MSKLETKKKPSEEEIEREEAESGKRVSGEPDSNLSAIGGGGIAGAAAGAAVGTAIGGPLGGAIGAAAGAVAGGVAADQLQDELDPKLEEVYWEENYKNRSYYKAGETYENYLPAYRLGWEAAIHKDYSDRRFDEIESHLKKEWEKQHGDSRDWNQVREIMRDSFERIRGRRTAK